jgi:hypothetical protein
VKLVLHPLGFSPPGPLEEAKPRHSDEDQGHQTNQIAETSHPMNRPVGDLEREDEAEKRYDDPRWIGRGGKSSQNHVQGLPGRMQTTAQLHHEVDTAYQNGQQRQLIPQTALLGSESNRGDRQRAQQQRQE